MGSSITGEALLLLFYEVRRHGSNGVPTWKESYPAPIPGVNEITSDNPVASECSALASRKWTKITLSESTICIQAEGASVVSITHGSRVFDHG